MMVVETVHYSAAHERWYTDSKLEFDPDTGQVSQYYTMAHTCECGEWVFDGEQICAVAHDAPDARVVHVNCCKEHDHVRA